MKTSSSLSDILNKNGQLLESLDFEVAEALLAVLDMVEGLLGRLALIFQHKYTSLKHTKSTTELIFEFPNNIRHICTTMPWTIFPALIVLWGVCWMFIIGSQTVDHESFTPTFSSTPAANGLLDASFISNVQSGCPDCFMLLPNIRLDADPSTALFDFTIDDRDSFDSLFENQITDHSLNPLHWANDSPRDPNFLTAGIMPDDQVDLNGSGIIHRSVVEAQSNELWRGNDSADPESPGRYVNCFVHKYRTSLDMPDIGTVKRESNVLYVPPANAHSQRFSLSSDIKHTPTAI